jgi:hypothetical protein
MNRPRGQRKKPAAYIDLHSIDEDKRIDTIGHAVMVHRSIADVITDAEPGKAERYIAKLKAKFPGIQILERFDGPTPGAVTVKVGPPAESSN